MFCIYLTKKYNVILVNIFVDILTIPCYNNHNFVLRIITQGGMTMSMKQKTVAFAGTRQQHDDLLKVISKHKGDKGALMPIMQEAQEIYGYLPIEVQTIISNEMEIPLEKIYGIATFYSQFSLYPKGKYTISVCLGTACYVKGAGDITNKLKDVLGIDDGECTPDGKFSLESCRCIGACGLAPVITVNEDVYGKITADDIEGIIAKYE